MNDQFIGCGQGGSNTLPSSVVLGSGSWESTTTNNLPLPAEPKPQDPNKLDAIAKIAAQTNTYLLIVKSVVDAASDPDIDISIEGERISDLLEQLGVVIARANSAIERIVSGQPASQKDTDSDDGETLGDSDSEAESEVDDYDLDDPFIDDSEVNAETANASAANGDNASDNSRPRRRIRLA